MEFKYPFNIVFVFIPLACVALIILGYKKKENILKIMKINGVNTFKWLKIALISAGFGLMIFSLLGPQLFQGLVEVEKEGLDIYVLIDTSKSMLSEDIKPDRISRAKKIIENLINNLKGDRIGFIPFSSDAYIQMPLTDDYQMAKMFLNVIDTDMISGGGTNIAAALTLAHNSFTRSSSADKVVVILSDGEEHEKQSGEILKGFADNRLRVFTIGVGTEKGGLVPEYDNTGKEKKGYKKDENGDFVMSKLNPEILKELATLGKGTFYQASLAGDEIQGLVKSISSFKRDAFKVDEIRRYRQIYQYFLGAGILLFLLGYFLWERSKVV